mgnify:CR=1 FL=1
MLLRVRTPSGATIKLRIEPTLSYADALAKAAAEAAAAEASAAAAPNRPLPPEWIQAAGRTGHGLGSKLHGHSPPN